MKKKTPEVHFAAPQALFHFQASPPTPQASPPTPQASPPTPPQVGRGERDGGKGALDAHARRSGQRGGNCRQNRDDDVNNRLDKSLVHSNLKPPPTPPARPKDACYQRDARKGGESQLLSWLVN